MLALRIVEHLDVVENILPGLDAGLVSPAPYPFPLEQVEEALQEVFKLLRLHIGSIKPRTFKLIGQNRVFKHNVARRR